MGTWYYIEKDFQHGPMTDAEIFLAIDEDRLTNDSYIWMPEYDGWKIFSEAYDLHHAYRMYKGFGASTSRLTAQIVGEMPQYLELEFTEPFVFAADLSAFLYLSGKVTMRQMPFSAHQAPYGDPTLTVFESDTEGTLALTPRQPSRIQQFHLQIYSGALFFNRDTLLGSSRDVILEEKYTFQQSARIYSESGFRLMLASGAGCIFLTFAGMIVEKELLPEEVFIVDLESFVAATITLDFSLEIVDHIKPPHLRSEAQVVLAVTGPGTIWVQTTAPTRLARRLNAYEAGDLWPPSAEYETVAPLEEVVDPEQAEEVTQAPSEQAAVSTEEVPPSEADLPRPETATAAFTETLNELFAHSAATEPSLADEFDVRTFGVSHEKMSETEAAILTSFIKLEMHPDAASDLPALTDTTVPADDDEDLDELEQMLQNQEDGLTSSFDDVSTSETETFDASEALRAFMQFDDDLPMAPTSAPPQIPATHDTNLANSFSVSEPVIDEDLKLPEVTAASDDDADDADETDFNIQLDDL